jgi:hypothetical protein
MKPLVSILIPVYILGAQGLPKLVRSPDPELFRYLSCWLVV